jgi:hypothetical protein
MSVVALYPDAELVAVTYLRAALAARAEAYAAGVVVGTKPRPGVLPPRYVRIRRTGGTEAFRVADSPRLQVQVSFLTGAEATDEANRQALAQLVWALLRGMQSGGHDRGLAGAGRLLPGGHVRRPGEPARPGRCEPDHHPADRRGRNARHRRLIRRNTWLLPRSP